MVNKTDNPAALWSFFEYFLGPSEQGIFLKSFRLIDDTGNRFTEQNAYLFEKITRPAMAATAREIKQYVKAAGLPDNGGQAKAHAGFLKDELKREFYGDIKAALDRQMVAHITDRLMSDERERLILVMTSVYFSFYLNREIKGVGLPPYYFDFFIPFLIISMKTRYNTLVVWDRKLLKIFFNSPAFSENGPRNLIPVFEDKTVKKIMSRAFASILSFLKQETDRALYQFEVVHNLDKSAFKNFRLMIANGFYTALGKEKRFVPKQLKTEERPGSSQAGIVSENELAAIIDRTVERYFDPCFEAMTQAQHAVSQGAPRKKSARKYEKAFVGMNRMIWADILKLVKTREREFDRRRLLLRLVIHYLFETRETDREFWVKYIASVERLIHYIYRDTRDVFNRFNGELNRSIARYREARLYAGTDWAGFYADPDAKQVAGQVLRDLVERSRSSRDPSMPAVWFSTEVGKGIDFMTLFRFIRQGRREI